MSEQYDDHDYDEDCYECGRDRCICVDDYAERECAERECAECSAWTPLECRVHGPAELAARQAEHEHYAVREALETILACPEAWSGPQWQCVLLLGREVLTAMEET